MGLSANTLSLDDREDPPMTETTDAFGDGLLHSHL